MQSRYRLHHVDKRVADGKMPGCSLYLEITDSTLLTDNYGDSIWDDQLFSKLNLNSNIHAEVTHLPYSSVRNLTKANLLTYFEFQLVRGIKPPYWAIYDCLPDSFLGKEYKDPSSIDFIVEPIKDLQLNVKVVKGDRVSKVFYKHYENNSLSYPILEKQYTYVRSGKLPVSKNKDFYWYKTDGTKHLLKSSGPNYFISNSRAEEHETKRRQHVIDEMKAEVRGTPIENSAINFLNANAIAVNNFVKTGSDDFRNILTSADRSVETWMNAPSGFLDENNNSISFGDIAIEHLNIYE